MSTSNEDRPRVGLLAAWGRFPIHVAEAMRREGYDIRCLAVRGHADRGLKEIVDDIRWVGAAQLGAAIRYFNSQGVTRATMAGKIHKAEIYRPWAWLRFIPDLTFLRTFYPHFIGHTADRNDDTILGTFVQAFARGGIEMAPATDFAPELLVGEGHLAGPRLNGSQEADVEFGWRLAKEMGRLDVGQSVCVHRRAAIAIEAIEGTDRCLERAGELCPRGGFTVVKVAKPQQDMRFDVPTVGLGTLETMARTGGRVLAIEAHRTILLDHDQFVAKAAQLGVSVVALEGRHGLSEVA